MGCLNLMGGCAINEQNLHFKVTDPWPMLLAGLPRATERITLRDEFRSSTKYLSFSYLLFFFILVTVNLVVILSRRLGSMPANGSRTCPTSERSPRTGGPSIKFTFIAIFIVLFRLIGRFCRPKQGCNAIFHIIL
jgi:hypothetical protein